MMPILNSANSPVHRVSVRRSGAIKSSFRSELNDKFWAELRDARSF